MMIPVASCTATGIVLISSLFITNAKITSRIILVKIARITAEIKSTALFVTLFWKKYPIAREAAIKVIKLLNPLHGAATINETPGRFKTFPSLVTGIPKNLII